MAINLTNFIEVLAVVVLFLIIVIFLVYSLKKSKRNQQIEAHTNEQIYVGNLPYQINEYDLKHYFTQFGSIRNTKVVKDYRTGRSKGFGFITYSKAKDAESALAAHGQDMQGRAMVVRIAKPRGDS